MYPDLFTIGPLTLHTYGVLVTVGIIFSLVVSVKIAKAEGIKSQQILDMGVITIACALIGSRIAYVLLNLTYYENHLLEVFQIWGGGFVFSGGLVAGLLYLIWYAKRHHLSLWKVGDIWAPAVALGQGIGRIGCLMAGCFYGKPAEVKWAVTFIDPKSMAPLNIPLHPTQIYAALIGFILFSVLIFLHARKKFDGQILIWFLILHSTARLLLERFRGDERGLIPGMDMSITQGVALLILLAAVITLIAIKSKQNEGQA